MIMTTYDLDGHKKNYPSAFNNTWEYVGGIQLMDTEDYDEKDDEGEVYEESEYASDEPDVEEEEDPFDAEPDPFEDIVDSDDE